jgi:hypothetical protein
VEEIVIVSLWCDRSLSREKRHVCRQDNGGIDEIIHQWHETAASSDINFHICPLTRTGCSDVNKLHFLSHFPARPPGRYFAQNNDIAKC